MKPTFILLNTKTFIPFVFVVPPLDLEINTEQQIKSVNLIQFGEYTKAGERNCDTISFSSFFPSTKSNFYSILNPMLPFMCVKMLTIWKDNGDELKLIIPEFMITKSVIITNFRHIYDERTGDISFDISLKEKREKKEVNKWLGLIER